MPQASLGEQFVQRVLAEYSAQRRLRELARRLEKLFDLDHRLGRIDDAEVDDRVDLDRHVVAGDHILRRHVHHDRAQVDAHPLLDPWNDEDQAGAFHLPEPAEHEHDAALVLAQNFERRREDHEDDDQDDAAESDSEHH